MLSFSTKIQHLWNEEKLASIESIEIAKMEDLTFLAMQRERIMNLDHSEALYELVKIHKIESKIALIKSISDNGLFTIK
jgi:hypothetical protein